MDPTVDPSAASPTSLRELALLFFRLGATAFGGPAAHIALMRDEVVKRRGWLSDARFLDLLGATNLIPGPSSTELAIHIGYERRGARGLLVAGLAFIVPAMLITGAIGWAYVRYGSLPEAGALLYGIKPVILAVIAQALGALAPKAAPSWPLRALGLAVAIGWLLGAHELALLLGAGLLVVGARRVRAREAPNAKHALLLGVPLGAGMAGAQLVTLPSLFWVFCKIGSVLFGSGYVLLAFLRADLVERLGWLSEVQLIDAIAVGQLTPGPVFTTATFIGYVLAGPSGALTATVGMFLPAFIFVAVSGPLIPRLRASPVAGAFLDGVNVASLALMGVVTAELTRAAIIDLCTLLLAVTSAVLLLRFKLGPTWLLVGGALGGLLAQAVGWAGHA
jgi:chromate transporter